MANTLLAPPRSEEFYASLPATGVFVEEMLNDEKLMSQVKERLALTLRRRFEREFPNATVIEQSEMEVRFAIADSFGRLEIVTPEVEQCDDGLRPSWFFESFLGGPKLLSNFGSNDPITVYGMSRFTFA